MADLDTTDDCYRCGYNLHGIADDQACPECGLLAERSRRASDELHLTRPTWLRRLFLGVLSILLGLLAAPIITLAMTAKRRPLRSAALSQSVLDFLEVLLPLLGLLTGGVLICIGAWLLAGREGYGPADTADRHRRIWLRCLSFIPMTGVAALAVSIDMMQNRGWRASSFQDGWGLSTQPQNVMIGTLLLCSPIPALLFWQLRSLAKRARSAHLAEHCAIVGIGTSLSLIYVATIVFIASYSESLGFGGYWTSRSNLFTLMLSLVATAAVVITLWSLYLMTRFALAFNRAARQLRTAWNRDDRSLA